MLRQIALGILLVSLAACGKSHPKNNISDLTPTNYPNIDNTIYGQWQSTTISKDSDGITHSLNLYFNDQNQIGFMSICQAADLDRLTPEIAFMGQITSDQVSYTVNYHMVKKVTASVKSCELLISPTTFDYEVNGDSLTLTNEKRPVTFTRIR